jgi:GntR family transcriptional regulator
VTVRKTLQMLADDGLIMRQPGKGTFVQPRIIEENLYALQGFAEMMAAEHPRQLMEVLSFEVLPAPHKPAHLLGMDEGEKVLRIERRHHVRERPVAYAIIYLPFDLGRKFSPEEVETTPIYELLTRRAGISIQQATQRVTAIAASTEIAGLLHIAVDSPVLKVERVTYCVRGRPVEYIQLYYPGGQHELITVLYRGGIRSESSSSEDHHGSSN